MKFAFGLSCLALIALVPMRAQSIGSLLFEDYFDTSTLNATYWDPFVTDNAATGWPWNTQQGQPTNSSAVDRPNGNYLDYDLPSFIDTGAGLKLTARAGTAAAGFKWTGAVVSSYPDDHFGSTQGFTFQDAYVEVKAKPRIRATAPGRRSGFWRLRVVAAPRSTCTKADSSTGGSIRIASSPAI